MYQAITTRFIGPTNTRGMRIKATASAGSVTLDWDNALNADDNHIAAARALAKKYDWHGDWHGGGTEDGCVFVLSKRDSRDGFVILATEASAATK